MNFIKNSIAQTIVAGVATNWIRSPQMKHKINLRTIAATLVTFSAAMFIPSQASAFDAEAAKALAKENDCMKCHAIDKDKKGPSYKTISAKYKGKADGEDKTIKSMTSGFKAKLADGTEEDHKIIGTKDMKQIKNLAQWILSQ